MQRKMTRVLVILIMIFLNSGQATAQVEISFELIEKLIEWGMKIYETIENQKNPDKSRENIEIILEQVAEISSKLDALESHLDMKLDRMLNLLLADIKIEAALHNSKSLLYRHLSRVDHYFDKSRDYKLGGIFGNQTLKDFSHKVLWSDVSVPDSLDEIHDLFISNDVTNSGLLSLMLQRTTLNILRDCNTYISAQQQVYYLFINLIISETKALLTLQQCHMINRLFDETGYTYMSELNDSKTNFERRLTEYYDLFHHKIGLFPQQIRRCEGTPPVRGDNFLELQKFSRVAILDENVVRNNYCVACPSASVLDVLSLQTNTTITNCKDMGTTITACPAESGSPHDYLWLQDEAGTHYGPDTPCTNKKTIYAGLIRSPGFRNRMDNYFYCKMCACTVQTNNAQSDHSAIWRISVTDQVSDLWNNKVVTGIRLVTQDNALHIQIQHTRFSYSGMIPNDSEWKGLDIGYYDRGIKQVQRPMSYEPLRHDRNSLYLDDIKVPEGFAMTGVRFQTAGDHAFKLQIFVSEFELGTGDLFPFGGRWIDASTHPMRPVDYKRERTEIEMEAPDDPSRSSQFTYSLTSNKLIKFTHTDMKKDAGQTTIPLLDAQSAETVPPFPLGGIGLSFIERSGFSGYITPRLYTLNITNNIKLPIIHGNIPLTASAITSTTVGEEYEDTNKDTLNDEENEQGKMIDYSVVHIK